MSHRIKLKTKTFFHYYKRISFCWCGPGQKRQRKLGRAAVAKKMRRRKKMQTKT